MIFMNISDFNYNLPKELIAQTPLLQRDSSRLMVISQTILQHKKFTDIVDYFSAGDVLVLNDSMVFPAKLVGKRNLVGGLKFCWSSKLTS